MCITKETLRELTFAIQDQMVLESKLSDAIRALSPDSYLMGTVSERLTRAHAAVYKEMMGAVNYDWWDWWMYETDFGSKNTAVTVNHQDFQVDTFDKFYEVCLIPCASAAVAE